MGYIGWIVSTGIAVLALLSTALPAVAMSRSVVDDPAAPPAQARPSRWCTASGDLQVIELRNCRLADDGSVKVFWDDPALIDAATADAVIDSTREAMKRYARLGLKAASISALNQVDIAILPGDDSPLYSWKLGTVSVSAVSAKKIGMDDRAARLELWHELFHWIQDENYLMGWARLHGDLTWWLETTAELGTFLIDPEAVDHNLNLYGRGTLSDNRTLALALAPQQWQSSEQYIQAQRLVSAMCPSGCPLSQESFIAAINAGTYPLEDGDSRARFDEDIDTYARYILTGKSNAWPTSPALASGGKIGNHLVIKASADGDWSLVTDSYPPQIDTTTGRVDAPLEANSIYPLLVASGPAGAKASDLAYPAGVPAMLKVEPGPELWYRIDGGEVQHHDGESELVLGPIQASYGIGEVRIVAAAHDAPARFRASLEPADLSGDWVFEIAGKPKITSTTCKTVDDSAAADEDLLFGLSSIAATMGTYVPHDRDDFGSFSWQQEKPFRLEKGGPVMTYASRLEVGDKEVSGVIEFSTDSPKGASLPLGLAIALVPLGLLPLVRRRHLAAIALLVISAIVSGCIPGVSLEVDLKTDLHFDKLEWAGMAAATGKAAKTKGARKSRTAGKKRKAKKAKASPEWTLSGGRSTVALDFTYTLAQDKKKDKKTRCLVEALVPVRGKLYPDGTVKPPKMG